MDLQALADLGEFIGAIAVTATLVYVGFQLRVNTRATIAQGTAAIAAEMQANLGRLAESKDLAAAFNKAVSGEALSAVEATQLRFWFYAFLRGAESHVLQNKLGAVDREHILALKEVLRGFCSAPFFRDEIQMNVANRVQTEQFRSWLRAQVLQDEKSS